jgi:hypothetical protein
MKRGEARAERAIDAGCDAVLRAPPLRIAEILRPWRRVYDALPEKAQQQFLEVLRLFAAGRITNLEWQAAVRAARARYEAALPAPVPPGGGNKANDRPYIPPQGW